MSRTTSANSPTQERCRHGGEPPASRTAVPVPIRWHRLSSRSCHGVSAMRRSKRHGCRERSGRDDRPAALRWNGHSVLEQAPAGYRDGASIQRPYVQRRMRSQGGEKAHRLAYFRSRTLTEARLTWEPEASSPSMILLTRFGRLSRRSSNRGPSCLSYICGYPRR